MPSKFNPDTASQSFNEALSESAKIRLALSLLPWTTGFHHTPSGGIRSAFFRLHEDMTREKAAHLLAFAARMGMIQYDPLEHSYLCDAHIHHVLFWQIHDIQHQQETGQLPTLH